MSKQMISAERIERLRTALADAPPKPKRGYVVRDVVTELASVLLDFRRRGYDLADIAAYFAQAGIQVSSSTLGSYLRNGGQIPSARKGKPQPQRRNARTAARASAQVPDSDGLANRRDLPDLPEKSGE